MNLYLHDIEDAQIRRGDTLRDPRFRDERGRLARFDVVITNPPFSLKNWGADVWANDPWGRPVCGVPPAGTGDLAWVQHMLASMNSKSGRLGVVMPHGVLFRGGAEGAIRECLIKGHQLDAVVGLPPNLFYSTTIPACLLVFRASRVPERRDHVLFVDGSKRFAKATNQNQMNADDVESIVAACRTPEDPVEDRSVTVRLVPHSELEENGWDLSVGRYLRSEDADTVSVEDALAELRAAQTSLRAAEATFDLKLRSAEYE